MIEYHVSNRNNDIHVILHLYLYILDITTIYM